MIGSVGAVPVGEVMLDVVQRSVHEVGQAAGEVEVHGAWVYARLHRKVAVKVYALHSAGPCL